MCSCGAKNATASDAERVESKIETSNTDVNSKDYSDLIKSVHANLVFAIDADSETSANPERYFTANALKKLRDSYEFDCMDNNCYAFYGLRTREQDSKPGTTGESEITGIESIGDNWYMVKYSDMGWTGMTRIKIVDGKIDDFARCAEAL